MTMIFAPIAILWAFTGYIYKREKYKQNSLGWNTWSRAFCFFLTPVILKKFAHVDSVLSGYFDYRAHFCKFVKLFISREWGYGSSGFPNEKLNLSLGIVQWLVLFAGLLALISYKKTKFYLLLLSAYYLLHCFLFYDS